MRGLCPCVVFQSATRRIISMVGRADCAGTGDTCLKQSKIRSNSQIHDYQRNNENEYDSSNHDIFGGGCHFPCEALLPLCGARTLNTLFYMNLMQLMGFLFVL
jgi:hypothetical protein